MAQTITEHFPVLFCKGGIFNTRCPHVMSKTVRSSLRRKNPNGLNDALEYLKECDWYWSDMNSHEALCYLRETEEGTFLLRDSTDSRHLFTLSVRTSNGMTNIRVLFRRKRFTLDSMDIDWQTQPNFDCVIKLIYYYMRVSNNLDGRQLFVRCSNEDETDQKEKVLILKKPLFHQVSTLKHLCRRVVNRCKHSENIPLMKLPQSLEKYLMKYPYPI